MPGQRQTAIARERAKKRVLGRRTCGKEVESEREIETERDKKPKKMKSVRDSCSAQRFKGKGGAERVVIASSAASGGVPEYVRFDTC